MSHSYERDQLIGGYRGGRAGGGASRGLEAQRDMIEQENNRQAELLAEKTSALKQIALEMHGEAGSQNRFLDGMASDMDRTEGVLSSTMGRLGKLMDSGGQRYMCYLILFVVLVFLMLYYLLSARGSGDPAEA